MVLEALRCAGHNSAAQKETVDGCDGGIEKIANWLVASSTSDLVTTEHEPLSAQHDLTYIRVDYNDAIVS